jgi:DNA-binding response OmpR family regulator
MRYVTKPFVPKELTARIRAMMRRVQRPGPGTPVTIRLGDRVEIVPDEGVVRVEGEEVHLTRRSSAF